MREAIQRKHSRSAETIRWARLVHVRQFRLRQSEDERIEVVRGQLLH
jgi:hypothetical protein